MDSLISLTSELKEVNLRLKSDKEALIDAKNFQDKAINLLKKKLDMAHKENQKKLFSLNSQNQKEIFNLQQTIKLMSVHQETLEKAINTQNNYQPTETPIKETSSITQEPQYLLKTVNKQNKRITELITEIESLKNEKNKEKESFLLEKSALESTKKVLSERIETYDNEKKLLYEENSNLKGNNRFLEAKNEDYLKEIEFLKQKIENIEKDFHIKELDFHEKILNEFRKTKEIPQKLIENNQNEIKEEKILMKETQISPEPQYLLKTVNKMNKRIMDLLGEIESLKLEKKGFDTQKESILYEKLSLENFNKVLKERIQSIEIERKQKDEEITNLRVNLQVLEAQKEENLKEIDILKQKIDVLEKEIHSNALLNMTQKGINEENIQKTEESPQYLLKSVNKLNKKITDMVKEVETVNFSKKTLENQKDLIFQEKSILENSHKILNERIVANELEKKKLIEENSNFQGNNRFLESKNEGINLENQELKKKIEVLEQEIKKKEFSEALFKTIDTKLDENQGSQFIIKLQQDIFEKDLRIKDYEKELENHKKLQESKKNELFGMKEKFLENQEKCLLISTINQTYDMKVQDLMKENDDKIQEISVNKGKILNLEEDIKDLKEKLKNHKKSEEIFEFKEKNLILKEKILLLSTLNQTLIEEIHIKVDEISKIQETSQKNLQLYKEEAITLKSDISEKNSLIKSLEIELKLLKTKPKSNEIQINNEGSLELKEKYLILQEKFLILSALNQTLLEKPSLIEKQEPIIKKTPLKIYKSQELDLEVGVKERLQRKIRTLKGKIIDLELKLKAKDNKNYENKGVQAEEVKKSCENKGIQVVEDNKREYLNKGVQYISEENNKNYENKGVQVFVEETKKIYENKQSQTIFEEKIEKAEKIKKQVTFEEKKKTFENKEIQVFFEEKLLIESVITMEVLYKKWKSSNEILEKINILKQVT